jgi:phosphoglycerate dehydrogenase-like enzyme
VARRALVFGMRVVACSGRADIDPGDDPGITRLTLEDLLAESDAVSLHLPLNPATRGLIDRRAFARMRPGTLFINTARGRLVVETDLIESLVSGHLGGAGLDVLDAEPPGRDNPLLAMSNVVLSPHIAGIDTMALDDMAEQAAHCVIELYRGNWPEGCVLNMELRPDWRW